MKGEAVVGKKFDIIKSYSSRDYCIIMASDEEGVSLRQAVQEGHKECAHGIPCRKCHITPDWLLIYEINKGELSYI